MLNDIHLYILNLYNLLQNLYFL